MNAAWRNNFHATLVEEGRHLWRCHCYIELNMVRCGRVSHPREWGWPDYQEASRAEPGSTNSELFSKYRNKNSRGRDLGPGKPGLVTWLVPFVIPVWRIQIAAIGLAATRTPSRQS